MITTATPTILPIFVEIGLTSSAPHTPSLFFPFLFFSLPIAKTMFTVNTSNDADSPKDVPFEGFDVKNVQGIKTPKIKKKRAKYR